MLTENENQSNKQSKKIFQDINKFNSDNPQLTCPTISAIPTNFNEYYELQTNFIENLRKQSSKIESLINIMDRLKADNQLKDRQLQQYKRKQNEFLRYKITIEDDVRQQYQHQMQSLRNRINDLQIQNQSLVHQNSSLLLQIEKIKKKLTQPCMDNFHKECLSPQSVEVLQVKLKKMANVLSNCKQQNNMLRIQVSIGYILCKLEDSEKLRAQLQCSLNKNRNRIDNIVHDFDCKVSILKNSLSAKQRELLGERQLKLIAQQKHRRIEQQIYMKLSVYEDEIRRMIGDVAQMQQQSSQWHDKYLRFVNWVQWVDSLRAGLRYEKLEQNIDKQTTAMHSQIIRRNKFNEDLERRQLKTGTKLIPEHDMHMHSYNH